MAEEPDASKESDPVNGQVQLKTGSTEAADAIETELHWLEKLNLAGQIFLVVVGTAAACIYGCQLQVMRGQLAEMKGSSEQTNKLIGVYQRQLAQMTKQTTDTSTIAAQALAQANATHQIAIATRTNGAIAKQQLSDFENVQSAHLTIEDIKATENDDKNWTVTFILANRGNSVATVWQAGQALPSTTPAEEIAHVLNQEVPTDLQLQHFSLGPEAERTFESDLEGRDWDLFYKFVYIDIFGQKHEPVLFCLQPYKAHTIPCRLPPPPRIKIGSGKHQ